MVGNFSEITAFYKKLKNVEESDIVTIMKGLSQRNKIIICTNDALPTLFCDRGIFGSVTVKMVDLPIVDSCGAGDAFAAGFLFSLQKQLSVRECVETGNVWARNFIIENSKLLAEIQSN